MHKHITYSLTCSHFYCLLAKLQSDWPSMSPGLKHDGGGAFSLNQPYSISRAALHRIALTVERENAWRKSYTSDKSSCFFFGGLPLRFFSGALISEISLQHKSREKDNSFHFPLSDLNKTVALTPPPLHPLTPLLRPTRARGTSSWQAPLYTDACRRSTSKGHRVHPDPKARHASCQPPAPERKGQKKEMTLRSKK